MRWGVDTKNLDSDEGAKRVLSVCFDEIERSSPYMIVFLGQRYGWIPPKDQIEERTRQHGMVLEDLEQSVTALEIEYGAFRDPEKAKHCIFCIREPIDLSTIPWRYRNNYKPESIIHKEKLNELKKRVSQLGFGKVITYKAQWGNTGIIGLEKLEEALYNALLNLYRDKWQKRSYLNWQEKRQEDYKFALKIVKNPRLHVRVSKVNKSSMNNVTLYLGDIGSGKTSILAHISDIKEQEGICVCNIICGSDDRSQYMEDIFCQMSYFLEAHMGVAHLEENNNRYITDLMVEDSSTKWIRRFNALCLLYNSRVCLKDEREICFIIDDLHVLKDQYIEKAFEDISLNSKGKISFVLSAVKDRILNLSELVDTRMIEPLKLEEKVSLIEDYFTLKRKSLNSDVIKQIIGKKKSDNPKYLVLLLTRLLIMDKGDFKQANRYGKGAEGLDKYMVHIVSQSSNTIEGLLIEIIEAIITRFNKKQSKKIIMSIASSTYGLREEDIKALMPKKQRWSSIDFSGLIAYMDTFFSFREDGRLDYSSQWIKKTIDNKYMFKSSSLRVDLYHYIRDLEDTDIIKVQEVLRLHHHYDKKSYVIIICCGLTAS